MDGEGESWDPRVLAREESVEAEVGGRTEELLWSGDKVTEAQVQITKPPMLRDPGPKWRPRGGWPLTSLQDASQCWAKGAPACALSAPSPHVRLAAVRKELVPRAPSASGCPPPHLFVFIGALLT